MKRTLVFVLAIALMLFAAVSCAPEVPHEHEWDAGEVTTPPTCGAPGEKTYHCTGCEETKTEAIAATGAHQWDAGQVTTDPTDTTDGVRTFTCTVCGQHKTEPEPKLAICVATFAEFEQAFTDIHAEGETRTTIYLTADITWDAEKYDGSAAAKTFSPDMTGLTLNLGGHTISGVAKNAFNLTGHTFVLKNGSITGNAENDRYSININYSGTNASTSNGLKEQALAHVPESYTDSDTVWQKRIVVSDITATAMLCGYSTMEIKNCSFNGGKYRGLVMQGSSGIVENVNVLTDASASSAGLVAHSYGTVLVKGTGSVKAKFALYAANCATMILDSTAVVTASAFQTYALYVETQAKIALQSGSSLKCEPAEGKQVFYMRKGSMVEIAEGAVLKDATGAVIAKPIPAELIDSATNGSTDSTWAGHGVAPSITDNRTL